MDFYGVNMLIKNKLKKKTALKLLQVIRNEKIRLNLTSLRQYHNFCIKNVLCQKKRCSTKCIYET